MRVHARGLLLAATTAVTATCVGQLQGPATCDAEHGCSDGKACVVGRCRPPTESVAASRASRLVLEPSALAVVSGRAERGPVPAVLELGGDALTGALVLMRFPLAPLRDARLERAVLELTAAESCGALPTRLELSLRAVLEPWSPERVGPSRLPELGLPQHAGRYSTNPPRPLRLDVTEIVLEWLEHPGRHHGLALEAIVRGPPGAGCFGSGAGPLAGPTLTLYVSTLPDPTMADAGTADGLGSPDAGDGGPPEDGPSGDGGDDDLAQD